MTDKWLEDIREKMSTCEADEPEGLRDMIFTRLTFSAPARSRFRTRTMISAVAASVVIALSLASLWLTVDVNPIDRPVLAARTIDQSAPLSSALADNASEIDKIDNILKGTSQPTLTEIPRPAIDQAINDRTCTTDGIKHYDNPALEQTHETVNTAASTHNDVSHADKAPHDNDAYPVTAKKQKRRISVGVFTSGALAASQQQSSAANSFAPTYRWLGSTDYDDILTPTVRSRAANEIDTRGFDMHHNIPIRFGLSARYDLNTRLGIESGIVYTRLSSDISKVNAKPIKGEQTLHYVGMPLNVKYSLASWKAFSISASAGILMEKCVDGSLTRQETSGSSSEIKKSSISISEHALQWSSNISADMQLDITRHIGVYIEPGISYYFDNNSDVRNIYKDRPLNFNLNIGLRFTFGSGI